MGDQAERDRCRAIQRFEAGEKPSAIWTSLGYSERWFYKWLARFRTSEAEWFREQSRRPHNSPGRTGEELESLIKLIRGRLVEDDRFYGAQSIRWEMEEMQAHPLPSVRTINRVLARSELTRRRRIPYRPKGKKYPELKPEQPSDAHQTDFVGPLYVRGGGRCYALNSVDLATGRCASEIVQTKTAQSTLDAFWASWTRLGLPRHQQVDNEMTFYGSPRHPRGLGPLIRLSLMHRIEVWFIPMREPWRNGVIEKFNDIWSDRFYSRSEWTSGAELRTRNLTFEGKHNGRYRYGKLGGRTPNEALKGSGLALRFPSDERAPRHPLPKPESGRYHLVRFVRNEGRLNVFGEMFPAPPEAIYEYVKLTIDVERQRLGVFLDGKQIDEHRYMLGR